MLLPALALLVAHAAAVPPQGDRLKACLDQAQSNPTAAIALASKWLGETHASARAQPQECLGQAYASLQQWNAAHDAFLAARDAALPSDHVSRARLGAMAGNAALAGKDVAAALTELDKAVADAALAGDKALAGSIGADKARALVAAGRDDEAAKALEQARADAPQDVDVWLLSATLSRRMGDLTAAQAQIETAGALDGTNPAIGLEAGVIAELAGDEPAARKSWQSVIAVAANSPEAASAKGYLAQIGGSGQ